MRPPTADAHAAAAATAPAAATAQATAKARPRWRRRVTIAVGALAAATALVALAHAGPFKKGLRAVGGCPVGATLTAEEHDAFRVAQTRGLAGEAVAPGRGVGDLGVELGRSTKDDVRRWAAARSAHCEASHADTSLTCEGVAGLEGVHDVFFRFDASNRVVAADIMHAASSPDDGARLLARVAQDLRATHGAPSSSQGELTAAALADPGSAATVAYRFRDLAIDVTALHGEDGVVVRRQFRAVQ